MKKLCPKSEKLSPEVDLLTEEEKKLVKLLAEAIVGYVIKSLSEKQESSVFFTGEDT